MFFMKSSIILFKIADIAYSSVFPSFLWSSRETPWNTFHKTLINLTNFCSYIIIYNFLLKSIILFSSLRCRQSTVNLLNIYVQLITFENPKFSNLSDELASRDSQFNTDKNLLYCFLIPVLWPKYFQYSKNVIHIIIVFFENSKVSYDGYSFNFVQNSVFCLAAIQ